MHKRTARKLMFIIAVLLMLLAMWAYLASMDESEPISEALSGKPPVQVEEASPR
jgi:hypothetical protein